MCIDTKYQGNMFSIPECTMTRHINAPCDSTNFFVRQLLGHTDQLWTGGMMNTITMQACNDAPRNDLPCVLTCLEMQNEKIPADLYDV